jgi:hypothetical protein
MFFQCQNIYLAVTGFGNFDAQYFIVSNSPSRATATPSVVVKTVQSVAHRRKESPAKEIVVNTKYDKCSDPLYRHLVYSTELDVFLTAKRGKVWLERMYARGMAATRELQDRQVASMEAPVPVALQYLYGGSVVVQGDSATQRPDEVVVIMKFK